MKCLFTNSKILIIELVESFINDRRFLLTYNFLSEVIKLITRFDIRENNKPKRSQNYNLLIVLIIFKIVVMLFDLLNYAGENVFTFRMLPYTLGTLHRSVLLGIMFLVYSHLNLIKKKNTDTSSTKIASFDLFILSLILLTTRRFIVLDFLLFVDSSWFIYLATLYLFYRHMPYIFLFVIGLKYIAQYLNIFKNMKVAFISDGNRRYLKENNLSKETAKLQGIYKIYEMAIACMNLEIKEVGFYCFSIKNFNRPKSEIDSLMNVIESGRSKFNTGDVRIRFKVYGRLNLLKENVRNELLSLMETTKNNKDMTVNLFIAYTTTDEIENGILFDGDVDLIIRTSGEQRLSDFLVRNVAKGTHVFFAKPYWPEFTIIQLIFIVIKYKLERLFFN